jgi:hypothetical protein
LHVVPRDLLGSCGEVVEVQVWQGLRPVGVLRAMGKGVSMCPRQGRNGVQMSTRSMRDSTRQKHVLRVTPLSIGLRTISGMFIH